MAPTRTILCLVETPGQFAELARLSLLLGRSRQVRQIYLVYDCGDATEAIVRRIGEMGAECLNASRSPAVTTLRDVSKARFGLGRAVRYLRDLIHLPVFAARYRRLLRQHAVDLVVIAEDNVASRSRALVAAAERLRISVLLLPFTIANPDEAAAAVLRLPSHRVRRWDQRAFAALFPRWKRRYRGHDLLRLPLGKAMMLELARLAPADPWIDNKGAAVIAVESAAMQQQYRAMGVPPEKIALTGSLVDPAMEHGLRNRTELRAALRRRAGLPDKPILLCALPPDQFRLGPPDQCEYASYRQLLAGWLASLTAAARTFAIVIRPHPRLEGADLEQLQASGLAIAWDDTASLIPLCDLYVASSSATIRWAIACGRPVVNYDVYRYDYTDYAGVAGVLRVENARAFDAALDALASSPDRLHVHSEAQAAASSEWGCLDGRSEERLLALCDRLMVRR